MKAERGKEHLNLKIFSRNILAGIGWAVGASFGFAVLVTILTFVLRALGGLPLVGDFFASLVEATQTALQAKESLGR